MERWEEYPHIWKSKSEYYQWLRGHFRRIWSRYPLKIEFKKKNSYLPPDDYVGRAKKLGTCVLCGEKNIPISKLEVDHIHTAGGFDSKESAFDWFWNNLLCDESNMQLVHKDCHKIKSYADRMGIDFQSALIEKKAISLIKNKQDIAWLKDNNIIPESNTKKRKLQIIEFLKSQ